MGEKIYVKELSAVGVGWVGKIFHPDVSVISLPLFLLLFVSLPPIAYYILTSYCLFSQLEGEQVCILGEWRNQGASHGHR